MTEPTGTGKAVCAGPLIILRRAYLRFAVIDGENLNASLHRRLDAQSIANLCHSRTLIIQRGRKFGGCARIDNLAGGAELRVDFRIAHDITDISGDPITDCRREITRAEQADQAVELQRFVSGFRSRRDVIQGLRMLAVGQGDDFDLTGLHARTHDCVSADKRVDAPFGEIVDSLHRIFIRDLGHVEIFGFQPGREQQIIGASNGRVVQLAGVSFDPGGEFFHRGDLKIGRHAECDQRVGHARDRFKVFWIVRQLFMQQGMRGKGRCRREQKNVVVMRVEYCGNSKKGIATRTVLNDDRLAPFRREFIGQQPRRNVDPRTRAQRNNETDRALRPLTRRLRLRNRPGKDCGGKTYEDTEYDAAQLHDHLPEFDVEPRQNFRAVV